ncbi:1-alkyl-2-acetylglycerophosphocholine esterase [Powellomyces hirtus]|uniref:1-alkyl-2-acetylglycerophosphocholine esterase n=1 Tax=Powellomyces hirtus TaxID=109895 RepID=A0A507E9V2_9FUNG|nr:1-alkyl-2-acetylglycerophosphocholine esterase [Powellomyces hirtus]
MSAHPPPSTSSSVSSLDDLGVSVSSRSGNLTGSGAPPAISLSGIAQSKGWFSRMFLPTLPDYLGPYPVGVHDIETPANAETGAKGVLVRLYYPTIVSEARKRSRAHWLPKGMFYALGYGNFSKMPSVVSMGLFYPALAGIKTPGFLNASLHPAGSVPDDQQQHLPPLPPKVPPVVFSHGLGGMRTTYSTFCGNLASQGLVVAAIEHRDGSAAVSALNNHSDKIPYKVPDEKHLKPGQSVDSYLLELRRGQLALKAVEVQEVVQLLRDLNDGADIKNLMATRESPDIQSSLRGRLDFDNAVVAGHSFGAASALTAMQDKNGMKFKAGIALDPWMHAVDGSLPVSTPFISIQSESFQWKANLDPLRSFFSHRECAATSRFGVLKGTAHQDVSDFPVLFPGLMLRIKLRGTADPAKSLELYHAWHMQFLKDELQGCALDLDSSSEKMSLLLVPRVLRHSLATARSYRLPNSLCRRTSQLSSTEANASGSPAVKGWRKYASNFKSHPASHLVSFAILHELTAIVPLPLVYLLLSNSNIPIPFPEDVLAEGNKRMSYMLKYFGFEEMKQDSKAMLHMATSYAVVKAAMPIRIGLCVATTPWFARVAVVPVQTAFRKISSAVKARI